MAVAEVDAEVIHDAAMPACRVPSVRDSQPRRRVADSAALDLSITMVRSLITLQSPRQPPARRATRPGPGVRQLIGQNAMPGVLIRIGGTPPLDQHVSSARRQFTDVLEFRR